ncbi:MAG: flagellar export chaperone FliS [Gammaproteobacteria bacterium]|nr:flagellar export chaperone FliS [Gammaproteobacteria bacterium]|tara:strand:+ start:174 stop:566 length:393 start_codon:yes stop_codon:yes gene_type:complete
MNSIARAAAYDDMATNSIVMGSSSHGLITLLFEELDNSLKAAEFFLDNQDLANTRKSVTKASRVLAGLQGSLDFDKGGELAVNLAELYRFCIKELIKVTSIADKEVVTGVRGLISPIHRAWNDMPETYKR